MSELVEAAFRALGPSASWDKVKAVAATLRESDDEETIALLEGAADSIWGDDDDDAWDELKAIAEEADAGPFTALDLITEYALPGAFPKKSHQPWP